MKSILVPVGSSKNAQSHLQYAIDFAKDLGAKVYVIQIYNVYTKAGTMIKIDPILERESLNFLKKHVSKIDKKGVEVIIKSFKGKLVNTIALVSKKIGIDLILIEPRINSINETVFLGKTSGKIIKKTNIPALIVPENYKYKPMNSILFALKSSVVNKNDALIPLKTFKNKFVANINLLLVKTPYYKEGDFIINGDLKALITKTIETENATTFHGVLEHFKSSHPSLVCVVRRKRGFFTKLWEENRIFKKDFHITSCPVLVLSGLK